jgi:hypothetical protein
MTNFELMRQRLEHRAGILPPLKTGLSFDQIRKRETVYLEGFKRLMENRLMIGALRYGLIDQGPRIDRTKGLMKRARQYQETGNLEFLVDLANICLIEFHERTHPLAHWEDVNADHAHE